MDIACNTIDNRYNINALKAVRERGYMDGVCGKALEEPFDIFAFSWCKDRSDYVARIYGFMYRFAYLKGRKASLSQEDRSSGLVDFVTDKLEKERDYAIKGMAYGRAASQCGRTKAAIRDADLFRVIEHISDNSVVQMVYDFWEYGFDTMELQKGCEPSFVFDHDKMLKVVSKYNEDDTVEYDDSKQFAAAVNAYTYIAKELRNTERDDMLACVSCPEAHGLMFVGEGAPFLNCVDICEESIEFLSAAFADEMETILRYVTTRSDDSEQDVYYDI